MAEPEPPKSIETGFTLIEVLISVVIFSLAIGLSSNLIATGMKQPFISHPVEPWLNFMVESTQALAALPAQSPLTVGNHSNPLPIRPVPDNLKSWKIEWKNSQLPGVKYAIFSVEVKGRSKIFWRVYRKNPTSKSTVID